MNKYKIYGTQHMGMHRIWLHRFKCISAAATAVCSVCILYVCVSYWHFDISIKQKYTKKCERERKDAVTAVTTIFDLDAAATSRSTHIHNISAMFGIIATNMLRMK